MILALTFVMAVIIILERLQKEFPVVIWHLKKYSTPFGYLVINWMRQLIKSSARYSLAIITQSIQFGFATHSIPMNENVIDEMMKSGLYRFWMGNQLFYIEVLPIAFQVNGYNFLREEAKTMLLPARGNERIFEFTDVMQLDFFMLRFNE